jgi:hypothetical protein
MSVYRRVWIPGNESPECADKIIIRTSISLLQFAALLQRSLLKWATDVEGVRDVHHVHCYMVVVVKVFGDVFFDHIEVSFAKEVCDLFRHVKTIWLLLRCS